MPIRLTSLFTCASLIGAIPALAQEPYTIGLSAPVTGPVAAYGEQMRKAAQAYQVWINAKGGVLGRPIALKIEDDECSPKSAVSVANRLAGQGVQFVIGPLCSGATSAARDTYHEAGILTMTIAQGDVSSPDYPGLLRINASNHGIARQMIREAQGAGYRRVALLHLKDAYGDDLKRTLMALAQENGMVMSAHAYEAGLKDFFVYADKIASDGAQAVMIAGYVPETLSFTRQIKERYPAMPLIFSGTGTNPDLSAAYYCAGGEQTDIRVVAAEDGKQLAIDPALRSALEAQGQTFQESAYFTIAALEAWRAGVEKTGAFDVEPVRRALLDGGLPTMLGEAGFIAEGPLYGHPRHEPVAMYEWACPASGQMVFRPVQP